MHATITIVLKKDGQMINVVWHVYYVVTFAKRGILKITYAGTEASISDKFLLLGQCV